MLCHTLINRVTASQNLIPQAYLLQHPWLGNANKLDRLSIFGGTPIFPFTGATWQLTDAGQLILPPFPLATQGDGAQVYTTIAAQSTTAATEMDADWGALMPVDGELLAATFQNNSIGPTLSGWIWLYFDGLSLHNAAQATAGWSLETTRIPNPAHAGGGAGVVAQATPSIISVGDTLPRVDPIITTINGAQTTAGVNQWVVVATDNAATVLPMTCQITYAPLYLEPTLRGGGRGGLTPPDPLSMCAWRGGVKSSQFPSPIRRWRGVRDEATFCAEAPADKNVCPTCLSALCRGQ